MIESRMMRTCAISLSSAALVVVLAAPDAQAKEITNGGKLLLTRGVTAVEGAGGGGLSTWALITGNETDSGIGGSAFATNLELNDYQLRDYGAAVGFFDRVEISYAQQQFHTGGTGALLGLGAGFEFKQDIWGVKVRVAGDAVYGQDTMLPQIAIGAQYKSNDQKAIVKLLGATDSDGVDYFVSATKVVLNQNLVLNGTLRLTKANQFGILGFGGNKHDDYSAQFEGAAGYLVSDRLLVGAEYRSRPDNLTFAKEDDAVDIFAALAVTHNLSLTAAWVDAGDIATFKDQRGLYLSLQAAF